jgi:hypothetical protein
MTIDISIITFTFTLYGRPSLFPVLLVIVDETRGLSKGTKSQSFVLSGVDVAY